MPTVRATWREGVPELVGLAPRWDALVPTTTPYAGSDWLLPWLDAFAGRRRLVVCTVERGDELAAGLPLLVARGGRLVAPVNDHTPVFAPVWRDEEALQALAEAVLPAVRGALRVGALADGSPLGAALRRAADRRGLRCLQEPAHVSPYVDLRAGHAAWRRATRSRTAEHERRRRKLRREHEVEVVAVERPEQLGRCLEEGLALEAAGWKGRQGTAVLCSPVTARFYREVTRRFDARDELRLSLLRVDGRAVGFDLALLVGGRYNLLKTAYDEDLRRFAPGMVLRLDVLEQCFALRLDRHEFLGPDMPWKRVFADDARSHAALSVYAPGPLGRSQDVYRRYARPALRRAYREASARATALGSRRG